MSESAAFIREKLPKLRRYSVPVFANVFGYAVDDYAEAIRMLEDAEGIAAYELNVSCPNTKEGGIFFSSDPALLSNLIAVVRPIAKRPLIVKLSPNVASIEPFAKAAAGKRSGCNLARQYVCIFRYRSQDAKAPYRRRFRRTLRSRNQAHCIANGV